MKKTDNVFTNYYLFESCTCLHFKQHTTFKYEHVKLNITCALVNALYTAQAYEMLTTILLNSFACGKKMLIPRNAMMFTHASGNNS